MKSSDLGPAKFIDISGKTLEFTTKAEFVAWQLAVTARKTSKWREYIPMGESVLSFLSHWDELKV